MTPTRKLSVLAGTLAALGLGALAVAQIESKDRGVPPIDSSANFEVGGIRVDVAARTADQARAYGWRVAQRRAWQQLWAKANGQSPGAAPNLDVSAGKDGITISLADSVTSGMFEVGSAKPTAEAVRLVEGIAKLLAERPGEVVVRGHTDSRPYAGAEYDNWRLSAARAQFAYYMLVNGGLDQNRVQSIEGVADRDPKDAAHPESAVNRRIEILLKEPQA